MTNIEKTHVIMDRERRHAQSTTYAQATSQINLGNGSGLPESSMRAEDARRAFIGAITAAGAGPTSNRERGEYHRSTSGASKRTRKDHIKQDWRVDLGRAEPVGGDNAAEG